MKSNIDKFLLVTCLFALFNIAAYSQDSNNATGYPVLTKVYIDVEGSPYLTNDYNKGIVKLANGTTYKDILIKYNQIDDVIYFQGENNNVLSFIEPVKEFTIAYIKGAKTLNNHYRNGYPAIGKNSDKSYYEVLTDGTAQLLKRTSKYIVKNKPYNSATETQTVNEDISYYIFADSKMTLIKKDKKYVLSVLNNKQTELDAFIKSNNLNLKNDDDLTRLVVYYNSL